MSKCFFIGHRRAPEAVRPLLRACVERHIVEYGVTEFWVGHYGAFDGMAADVLCEMKKRYPHIRNDLLLAYHPAVRAVPRPDGLDSALLLDGQESVPPRFAISRLNQRAMRQSDYLICYVRYITDGSYQLLEAAKGREKRGKIVITNLAEQSENP